jgi:uncharacterized protein (TIGR03435 family)
LEAEIEIVGKDLSKRRKVMRNWLLSARSAGVVLTVGMLFGPARAAGPEFDVASIKPAAQPTPELFRSGKIHIGMTVDGARVDIGGMPLTTLIQQAFRVKLFQVVAPDWARESRWDILATLPDGGSQEQVPEMLGALLADRFKLVAHRENKELPVYALVVGKGGLKMKASVPDPGAAADAPAGGPTVIGGFGFFPPPGGPPPGGGPGPGRGPGDGPGGPGGGGSMTIASPQYGTIKISGSPQEGRIHLEVSKVSMAGFADLLTGMTDRPVVDMTGLSGDYQVALDASPEELIGGMARAQGLPFGPGGGGGFGGPGGPGGPDGRGGGQFRTQTDGGASDPSGAVVSASVEKLGLKLEPRKSPVESIVVDHLEKAPTEN